DAALPLPRLRQPGHHRPHGGGGGPARLPFLGTAGLVVLAHRPPVLPDRLPQPAHRAGELGLVVLDLPAARADHRRRRSLVTRRSAVSAQAGATSTRANNIANTRANDNGPARGRCLFRSSATPGLRRRRRRASSSARW